MDLVRILSEAIERLPPGDYSEGLSAILRHIVAAVRHLERDNALDPDRCTDAIYRTNQAYEGSLKEAYRVLAEKDPSGLRTYDIEQYLETEGVLRARVLTQLARYRQDYRNPSTHDYRLDFDRAEALLAIVSVCAFAMLLIDQMSAKLTADRIKASLPEKSLPKSYSEVQKIQFVAENMLQRFEVLDNAKFDEEIVGAATGILQSLGLTATVQDIEHSLWDITATDEEISLGLELRFWDVKVGNPNSSRLSYLRPAIGEVNGAILIEYTIKDDQTYNLFIAELKEKPLFVITPDTNVDIAGVQKDLKNIKLLKSKKVKSQSRAK